MRILAFSAHVADFCSRSGGTLAKAVKEGGQVRVVALTNGERSESGGLYAGGAKPSIEEVKAVRVQEGKEAAEIIGAEIRFLDWGDLSFDFTMERVKTLAEEIREFRPDAIVTHHGPDPVSVDHDTCYRLVLRAAQVAGAPGLESERRPARRPPIFLFEATIPLTELEGFNPDLYVDITEVWETKLRALQAFHRAQGFLPAWYTDQARLRAFQAQRLCGNNAIQYAEAFERVQPWVGKRLPLDEL
ncbi:MAG: PIG-L family deacetylase [Chloroflexi bacterium]|nr:PIG-L family deacetylase [Chloroflexota bacterium]